MATLYSNHIPLLITINFDHLKDEKRKKFVMFEAKWTQRKDFQLVIHEEWNHDTMVGDKMQTTTKSLIRCKDTL